MDIKEAIEILEKEGLFDNFLTEEESEVKNTEEEPTIVPEFKKKAEMREDEIKTKEDSDSDEEFITLQPQGNEENIFTLTKPKYFLLIALKKDIYMTAC